MIACTLLQKNKQYLLHKLLLQCVNIHVATNQIQASSFCVVIYIKLCGCVLFAFMAEFLYTLGRTPAMLIYAEYADICRIC